MRKKRYLTVTSDNVGKYIEYILSARNKYIDEGYPIDDVNELLIKFMKAKKKLRA